MRRDQNSLNLRKQNNLKSGNRLIDTQNQEHLCVGMKLEIKITQ